MASDERDETNVRSLLVQLEQSPFQFGGIAVEKKKKKKKKTKKK